jgi:hypothetical protein
MQGLVYKLREWRVLHKWQNKKVNLMGERTGKLGNHALEEGRGKILTCKQC